MVSEIGQNEIAEAPGHLVTWFTPDRPVAGTIYIRPDFDDDAPTDESTTVSSN